MANMGWFALDSINVPSDEGTESLIIGAKWWRLCMCCGKVNGSWVISAWKTRDPRLGDWLISQLLKMGMRDEEAVKRAA
jgi:hypothetical protein